MRIGAGWRGPQRGAGRAKESGRRRDSTQIGHETHEIALEAVELIYKKGYHFLKDLKKKNKKTR